MEEALFEQVEAPVLEAQRPVNVKEVRVKEAGPIQTGGKLYLAGEYAVLEPGHKALIQFVPFYLEASIQAQETYRIQSDLFAYAVGKEKDENYALIQEAVDLMEDYLQGQGYRIQPFHLDIQGQLGQNGVKYGLGSSGSVTLLVVKSLAALYGLELSADLAFRLASLVLLKRGDNGSMGDLAAISHQGLVLYQSFDRARVRSILLEEGLERALASDWGYEIELLEPSLDPDFLVGWTQKPALSSSMVQLVKKHITPDFLAASTQAVEGLEAALLEGNQEAIIDQVHASCHLLNELSPQIYTEELRGLKISQAGLDAVAKVSGAGGGDCGIALSFSDQASEKIKERWSKKGIQTIFQGRLGHYD